MNIALIVGVSIAASSLVIGIFILLTYLVVHTRRTRRRGRLGGPTTPDEQQQQPPTSTTHLPAGPVPSRTESPRETDGDPSAIRRENKLRRPPRARITANTNPNSTSTRNKRDNGQFYELGRMRRPPPPPLSWPLPTTPQEAESATPRPRSSRTKGGAQTPGGDRVYSPVPSFISPGDDDDQGIRPRRLQSGDISVTDRDAGPPSPQPSSDLGHGRSPRSLDLFAVNVPELVSPSRPLETLYVPQVAVESPRSPGFTRRVSRGIMVEREETRRVKDDDVPPSSWRASNPRIPDALLAALEPVLVSPPRGTSRGGTSLNGSRTPITRRI